MGPSRTELMQFKVTPYERKVIEDFVRKRHDTVSEYVRSAVIMDDQPGVVVPPTL